ncbi:hypothetical protein AB0G04_10440 [Actinoplanes sp. NPDC023801]|uniref:hypothetical protein n=1 Tax=Actinoplanes sp. NPDC023801 TaxID=3154595 RepID=UPI0034033634
MSVTAAGVFRRTPLERADQRVAWERGDQAFFAAGACHILAFTCRELHPGREIGLTAMTMAGDEHPFHVYATWEAWAFDASGWNLEQEVLTVNAAFENRRIERARITTGLAEFCAAHLHRMPDGYWQNPLPRARAYVRRFTPPWTVTA